MSWVIKEEGLAGAINYIEFGVAAGHSFEWFMTQNTHAKVGFMVLILSTACPKIGVPLKKDRLATTMRCRY